VETTKNVRNGVDLDQLAAAVESVKQDAANGKLTFTVSSTWMGGFKARHTTGPYVVGAEHARHQIDHELDTDEPKEILGSDSGFSPAETIISALAACLSVGYAANAAAMGIDLDELKLEITATGSLEGFMNLGGKRPGLSGVSIKAFVRSSAAPEKLQELHDFVNSHSPIWDTIANPVTVTSELETSGDEERTGRYPAAARSASDPAWMSSSGGI
jgi:uncharacterized OsmC-like protein